MHAEKDLQRGIALDMDRMTWFDRGVAYMHKQAQHVRVQHRGKELQAVHVYKNNTKPAERMAKRLHFTQMYRPT